MSGDNNSMIFPEHCKYIGTIRGELDESKPFYFSSRYLLQLHPAKPVVWELRLAGNGWLRSLEHAGVLARGDSIAFEEEDMDIFDRAKLIKRASQLCVGSVTTVVFFAPDGHCTFIHQPDKSVLREIQVLDITPENLATLHRTVRRMDSAGMFGDLELKFEYVSFDITNYAGDGTVYPCESSGIEGRYLNRGEIDKVERLVGCNVSQKILQELGGSEGEAIDFCPHTSPHLQPSAPFLARCCRSEKLGSIVRNGYPGVIVHWGLTTHNVYQAVRQLWEIMEGDDCSKSA